MLLFNDESIVEALEIPEPCRMSNSVLDELQQACLQHFGSICERVAEAQASDEELLPKRQQIDDAEARFRIAMGELKRAFAGPAERAMMTYEEVVSVLQHVESSLRKGHASAKGWPGKY